MYIGLNFSICGLGSRGGRAEQSLGRSLQQEGGSPRQTKGGVDLQCFLQSHQLPPWSRGPCSALEAYGSCKPQLDLRDGENFIC